MGLNAAAEADTFFKPTIVSGRTIDYYSAHAPRHMVGTILHPEENLLRVDYTMALFDFGSKTATKGMLDRAANLLQRDPVKNGNILRESQHAYSEFVGGLKDGMAKNGFDRKQPQPGLTVSFFCDPVTYNVTNCTLNLTQAMLGGRAHFHGADVMLRHNSPGANMGDLDLRIWKDFVVAQKELWMRGTSPQEHDPNLQMVDERMTLLAQRVICQDALANDIEAILCIDKRDVVTHTPQDLEIKPGRDGYISTTAATAVDWPQHQLRLPCASRGRPVAILNFALLSYYHQTGESLVSPLQAERMARFCAQHVVEREGRKRPDARLASAVQAEIDYKFGRDDNLPHLRVA